MNLSRDHILGDLLQAFKVLAPTDEPMRRRIAALLGLGWRGSLAQPPLDGLAIDVQKNPETRQTSSELQYALPASRSLERPWFKETPNEAEEPEQLETVPVELVQLPRDQSVFLDEPQWLLRAEPLPRPDEITPIEPPMIDSLLEPARSRAILTDALATGVADGPLDLTALVTQLSRGMPILELSYLRRRTLALGIEVLVDLAPTLAPFYEDQRRIAEQLSLLFGTKKTSILAFDKNPFDGAGSGERFDWQPWLPPNPARPILLLTDLGIGHDPDAFDLIESFDWRRFIRVARLADCEPLALLPYSLNRLPPDLVDALPILTWDRTLTIRHVRQALGRRWEVTG